MPLICRKCGKEADASRREYMTEMVAFIYTHKNYGAAPTEHKWVVLACDAGMFVEEDRKREREGP